MRKIATDNVARIKFGVLGGGSIDAKTSGGDIKADLEEIARRISEGSHQPKIMFGIANTVEQLQSELSRLVGSKPIQLNFGLGTATSTTKKQVRKYAEDTISEYQKSIGNLQTVVQTAFVKGGKELVFKQLGTTAKDAASEIDRLSGYLDKYGRIINSIPKITDNMPYTKARGMYDDWLEQHYNDSFIRAKNGSFAIESVFKYANKLSVATNEDLISFFNTIQQGALQADDRIQQLEATVERFAHEGFSAADMTELLGSNQFAEVLMKRIPEEMRSALETVNQELESTGAGQIDVDKLIQLDRASLSEYIGNALRSAMQEVEVTDPSGDSASAALKFKADISPEAQEELRASVRELVNGATTEPFALRFVADTSADGLSSFAESLKSFSQINGGQPVEVAITAGTSQETVDHLAESIRSIVEQVEGKEFQVQFTPADGSIDALRQKVESGFEDAIGVKLDVVDKEGNPVGTGSFAESTQAIQHHVEAIQKSVDLEKEKQQVSEELTKALNAENAALEKTEKQRAVASKSKKQTPDEKRQAQQEARMWAEYEKYKTQEAKAYSDKRAREAAAAAKEQARIEAEWADKVAEGNREAWERQEADFDRWAKQHTAAIKAKAQAEKRAAKDSEDYLKSQQKADKQAASSALSYDKLTNKLTSYFHKFEDEIKNSPALMAQYEQLLNNLNTQGFGDNMTNAAAAVQKFQIACEQAGIGANSFLKRLVSGFANKLFYGGLAKAAAELRRLVVQIYTNVKELDAAMTQLQIVTGASENQMKQFLTQSTQLARELGQSISDVMKSIETFSRLGYDLTDASGLARFATILSNVAAVDVGTATTGLTSIVKAFGMQVSDSEHVADVLVNVGQKYAISAEELMAAFERGGSALAATGTSFDKASALFAAANASMQNAEKIGTAIQTVSARIRGAKSELEELGADYEDVAEGVSKYRNELMALTNVTGTGGFDIMADVNTGKYKDIYDIFVGIAGVWNQLSDTSQARVAEILGGTRQLSVISSVIKNISDAQGALEVAQNSTGVALKANDTYLESIQGRVGVLTADFQDMSQSILNSGLIKFGVSALDILVRGIDKLAEAKVLLPGILAIITSMNAVDAIQHANASFSLFMQSVGNGRDLVADVVTNFTALGSVQQQYVLQQIADNQALNGSIWQRIASVKTLTEFEKQKLTVEISDRLLTQGLTTDQINAALAAWGLVDAEHAQAVAAGTAKGATLGFAGSLKALWATNPVGLIMMAASVLATILIPALSAAIKTAKELREELDKEKENLKELEDEYKNNADRISELLELKEKNDWSDESAEELQNLRDQNTELAAQIEYRKRIIALESGKTERATSKEWERKGVVTREGADGEMWTYDLTDFMQELKDAQQARQQAYEEFYRTGNHKALDASDKAIQDIILQGNKLVDTYDELREWLPKATRDLWDPIIEEWELLAVEVGNDAPVIIKALDKVAAELFPTNKSNNTDTTDAVAKLTNQVNTAKEAMDAAADSWNALTNGNVDYHLRPIVDAATMIASGWDDFDGEYATTFTSGYTVGNFSISVTPILDNGEVLSPEALEDYVDNLVTSGTSEDLLASDTLKLVVDYQLGDWDEEWWSKHEDALQKFKDAHLDAFEEINSLQHQIQQTANATSQSEGTFHSSALISGMQSIKEQAEESKISVNKYYEELAKLINLLSGNGASTEFINVIKELFKLPIPTAGYGSLAQAAVAKSGATSRIEQASLGQSVSNWLNGQTIDDLKQFEQFLSEVDLTGVKTFEELKQAFLGWQKATENSTVEKNLQKVFDVLDDIQEKLGLLNTAFKEASAVDGFGVTYKTLSNIAEKFKDVDGIDQYISRLAAAGNNAEKVRKILGELAGELLTNATNSQALANVSDDVIAALLREAGVSLSATNAMFQLRNSMVVANATALNFDQQISELQRLAAQAGLSAGFIAAVYAGANAPVGAGEWDELGNMTPDQIASYRMQQAAANVVAGLKSQITKDLKFDILLGTGGGGGSGGPTERYYVDLDQFRKETAELAKAQEEREQVERDISTTEKGLYGSTGIQSIKDQIGLQRNLIAALKDEQSAMHDLNDVRDEYIQKGVDLLTQYGMLVDYNADTNELAIQNLEYLDELDAGWLGKWEIDPETMSIRYLEGQYKDATEANNAFKQNLEGLIETIEGWNDANKESSKHWWDLADSIAEAGLKINDLLDSIIETASTAVDNVQSVYDTLHSAESEFAKTGNISVDTLQSLIALGPQYMQYLTNENGELEVNEERIRAVIDAKTDQLAVEAALAYVEALAIAKNDHQTDELDKLLNATEDYSDATWDLVDAKLAEIGLNDEDSAKAQHVIGMYRNMADVTRLNVTETEKYRDSLHDLEIAQRQQADLEHTLSRVASDNHQDVRNAQRQVAIQRSLIDTYASEQEIISNLRAQRSADIEDNIAKLRELGFVIQYNAETDDFYIENLEHLNAIQGASFESTQDLITRTEELVNSNKESADSYSELADSIADAKQNIDELLTTIVERASHALDNMQSLYDTLHQAADEYADTGFVSMDTVQSLIGLGTQYMQYLIDENGQLVINEDRIKDVIKAKMEELALDNAMAYVESIRLAKARGNNEEMQRLIFATEAAKDATWGLVYASIQLLDVTEEEREAIYHNVDAMRYLAEQSMENIGGEISNMKQSVSDLLQYVMDMLKQQVQDEIDALGEQKDAYSKIIQSQKEYLKNTKEANNYQKSVANKLKDIAKLQERIDALSLDNSREAQAQRVKLLEELREKQEDLEETQNDESISRQEDALDKMEEAYNDEKDAEIKALEKSVSSTEKLYRKAMDYLENIIGTDYKRLRDELCQWNYEVGNSFQSEIEAACDGALDALKRFGGSWNTVMSSLNAAGAKNALNNTIIGDTTPDYSHETTNEDQQKAKQQQYQPRVYLVQKDGNAPPGLNVGDYVVTCNGLYCVTDNTNGYSSRLAYAYPNTKYVDLGPLLERFKREIEIKGNRYHTGGIIGDSTLKQDEMMAVLQKGEAVLTSRQQNTVNNALDFMSSLSDRLSDALAHARIPSFLGGMLTGDLMNRAGAVGGEVNVQFGDVIINGADPDAISKHRAINREFVNEVVKVLNLRK